MLLEKGPGIGVVLFGSHDIEGNRGPAFLHDGLQIIDKALEQVEGPGLTDIQLPLGTVGTQTGPHSAGQKQGGHFPFSKDLPTCCLKLTSPFFNVRNADCPHGREFPVHGMLFLTGQSQLVKVQLLHLFQKAFLLLFRKPIKTTEHMSLPMRLQKLLRFSSSQHYVFSPSITPGAAD